MSQKIKDGRFIELIRRFLKSGYLEFNTVYNSFSGTPQGGIISPILANIYLHEFDKYMESLCKKLTTGKKRKSNTEYVRLSATRDRANRKKDYTKADEYLKKMRQIHSKDQMDAEYVRVKYFRYADDFLICIIGSKELTSEIKQNATDFLKNTLALELNQSKTLITNLKDNRVKFLGYEIGKSHSNNKITKDCAGITRRSVNGEIQLYVPHAVIQQKIKSFTQKGKPAAHRARVNMPILDIISQYNAEIRGLYNYYKLAINVSVKLGKFKYYHYYSLARTIALKEKSSVKKIMGKYGINVKRKSGTGTRKVIGVSYKVKNDTKILTYFNDSLKRIKTPSNNVVDQFAVPITRGSQLIARLNANKCEVCGCEEGNFEVHHVRKLKDIKNKYAKRGNKAPIWVIQMSRMNRKTLVLCVTCHDKLHAGKL